MPRLHALHDTLLGRSGRRRSALWSVSAVTLSALLIAGQGLVSGAQGAVHDTVTSSSESAGLLVSYIPDAGPPVRSSGSTPLASATREGGLVSPTTDVADEPLEDQISTQRVRIRLEATGPVSGDLVQRALEVDGVTFATAIEVGELTLQAAEGPATLSVAAVEPQGFRILAPQISADSDELWERIEEGAGAFTHEVAARYELELGARLQVGEEADEDAPTLRIGAHASNGAPSVADGVISNDAARRLGLQGTPTLLVSIAPEADAEALAALLGEATGMAPEVVDQPPTRQAFLTGAAARDAFEPFSYVSLGDGMIQIDKDWTARNIVSAEVPIFRGHVTCHRLLIPQLRGALEEVVDRGLDHLIDPSQYGGCWVPRHILFNPNRGLSMHAWGLAIDFNVRGNEYGNRNPTMDRRIVEIFERWGFVWGGHWSTPDGMHFELGALLDGSTT